MKWTADNDQLLFMKLIETHDVSIKAGKIREAWPKDGREVPTARAISERILKIKNSLKTAGGSSAPATPRKRKGSESVINTPKSSKTRKTSEDDNRSESPIRRVRRLGVKKVGVGKEPEAIYYGRSDIFYSFDGLQGEGQL